MDVKLANISKTRVQSINPNAPLISIGDYYSLPVAIPNRENRPLLFVDFFPGDHAMPGDHPSRMLTAEKAEQIVKFVEAQRKAGAEIVYVQCGEGRIRSYTIATTIENYLEGFRHSPEDACIKQGIVDRYTYSILRKVLNKHADV